MSAQKDERTERLIGRLSLKWAADEARRSRNTIEGRQAFHGMSEHGGSSKFSLSGSASEDGVNRATSQTRSVDPFSCCCC